MSLSMRSKSSSLKYFRRYGTTLYRSSLFSPLSRSDNKRWRFHQVRSMTNFSSGWLFYDSRWVFRATRSDVWLCPVLFCSRSDVQEKVEASEGRPRPVKKSFMYWSRPRWGFALQGKEDTLVPQWRVIDLTFRQVNQVNEIYNLSGLKSAFTFK